MRTKVVLSRWEEWPCKIVNGGNESLLPDYDIVDPFGPEEE